MPTKIDPKQAKSSYKNGVLEITVPRVEKKIKQDFKEIKID